MKISKLAIAAKKVISFIGHHPFTTLKLLRPPMIKKAWRFLEDNAWNLQRFIDRVEELYSRRDNKTKIILSEIVKPFIEKYKLPLSSGSEDPLPPQEDEIFRWVEDMMLLAGGLADSNNNLKASIIIPVHNQIRFTMACVHSILNGTGINHYEIIIADDNSSDQTFRVFQNRLPGIKYFRNQEKKGFLHNCNAAAEKASGQYIVFLNNDTIVYPEWLDELLATLEGGSRIGLVGSKLVFPEGQLQEAGGIVFADGSGWNYGRFEDAASPEFNYQRDVDYCSGASIAIPTKLWRQLGGFDERFAPAYYEDTDLAFRVREAGYRVVYQPLSEVVHFEGISNGRSESSGIKKYQSINKDKFYAKWKKELTTYGACNPEALPADRSVRGRVLVIDAVTPMPDRDSGSMDIYQYMKIIKSLGFHVTFVPDNAVYFDEYTRNLQRQGIECLYLPWIRSSQHAVELYGPQADIIMLCRVNVAAPLVDLAKRKAPRARILFDTVDLHYLREERQSELTKSSSLSARAMKTRTLELDVIDKADATILRSPYELTLLKKIKPEARLFHFPITREIPGPAPTVWEDRKDIVFIGGFAHPPNTDAVKYFVRDIWPILRRAGFSERFVIVGSNVPEDIKALERDDIIVRGFVEDLAEIFNHCLLSVAPLRYGAGMKGKVVTSLSYGVPCVATKIAAEGSGLVHQENILVAEDADEMAKMIQEACANRPLWERISKSGLGYCENAFSFGAAKKIIDETFSEILNIK